MREFFQFYEMVDKTNIFSIRSHIIAKYYQTDILIMMKVKELVTLSDKLCTEINIWIMPILTLFNFNKRQNIILLHLAEESE